MASYPEFSKHFATARAYATDTPNPMIGEDPDDRAEAWNEARDVMDIKTGGTMTCRQLDVLADMVTNIWIEQRDAA